MSEYRRFLMESSMKNYKGVEVMENTDFTRVGGQSSHDVKNISGMQL